jgi:CheY-like chemotaxis protein
MTDSIFVRLAGETKAMILLNEYRLGRLPLAELAQMVSILAETDLERIGIIELVRRLGPNFGVEAESAARLAQELESQSEIPLGTARIERKEAQGKTIRLHKFDTPPGGSSPAEMPTLSIKPVNTVQIRRRFSFGQSFSPDTDEIELRRLTPPEEASHKKADGFGRELAAGAIQGMKIRKILLADDDARIRMVFRKKLEENKYLIEEVETGEAAWARLQQENFALAIIDMKMPGLHGLELLARLTASGDPLPVIVCSAYEQLKDEFVVTSYPRLRYLIKPVSIDLLLNTVQELLA